MPSTHIISTCEIVKTPRVLQLEGMFELPPTKQSKQEWMINFELPTSWNVGVIVGPSGCGKTTVARNLFPELNSDELLWDKEKSVIDGFPSHISIKEIIGAMSSVGFSSPPSWLRPYQHLSNGEQFRCNIARKILEMDELAIVDEFTSVVDRTVAKITSAAVSKFVRRSNKKFVAISCHYDVLDWLEPDWVYEPHTNNFYTGRGLHQRPPINLEIVRCEASAWKMFRKHHYLDTSINNSAACFLAMIDGIPVAFSSVLCFPHPTAPAWREHRTVCLPDYQGVGIGNALSEVIASAYSCTSKKFFSVTGNPAMIFHRAKSKNWKMKRQPSRTGKVGKTSAIGKGLKVADTRMTASFEYIGHPNFEYAKALGII